MIDISCKYFIVMVLFLLPYSTYADEKPSYGETVEFIEKYTQTRIGLEEDLESLTTLEFPEKCVVRVQSEIIEKDVQNKDIYIINSADLSDIDSTAVEEIGPSVRLRVLETRER